MKLSFFAFLVAASAQAVAQNDVLVSPLPEDVDNDQILQMTRDVLGARGWELIAEDATTIAARKQGSGLRIFIAEKALRFTDRAQESRVRQRSRKERAPRAEVPEDEIAALRADLTAAFAGKPPSDMARAAPRDAGQLLLGNLPGGLSNEQILRAVSSALAERRWVVKPGVGDSVVAELASFDTDGKLKVFIVGQELRYSDRGTKNRSKGGAFSHVPDNWIANLRADTARLLKLMSTGQKAPADSAASPRGRGVAERLRAAKELHDSGAITRDEYEAKRAEILKGL